MLKVNSKDTKTNVSIVNFEQVNIGWVIDSQNNINLAKIMWNKIFEILNFTLSWRFPDIRS